MIKFVICLWMKMLLCLDPWDAKALEMKAVLCHSCACELENQISFENQL